MQYTEKELKQVLTEELPRLRRFAMSLTGNQADGDDLVHNLVVKILQKGMSRDVNASAWLFRVCKNIWLDEIRAREVRRKAIQEKKIPGMDDIEEPQQEPLFSVQDIQLAMSKLVDEQRVVVGLIIVEGFSYEEAADILEVPKGTIMSRLSRARTKLITLLNDQIGE
ncbi:MAG: RNA polymerase sigma factor [Aestuariibacter sp.]